MDGFKIFSPKKMLMDSLVDYVMKPKDVVSLITQMLLKDISSKK
jgi:hypothetical protein